jgi:hypothetical protein
MTGLARSSAAVLLIGACLGLGCGGKALASMQQGNSEGQAGQGGKGPGPETHATECESLCARTADAGCSAGDSACVMACATVTGFAGCQSQIDTWLACAEKAEVVCDTSGVPTFAGCDLQLTLAAACAAAATPPKVVQKSCGNYCDQIEAAGCSTTTPIGECRQACGLAGMVVSDCQPGFITYLDCAVANGDSCDNNGLLNATPCMAQQLVYLGCVLSSVGAATLPSGTGGTAAK